MRVLVTFPGRYGDLLWALPSIRALSRRIGAPVDLHVAGEFASIVPLLQAQPYLGEVQARVDWVLEPPEEWDCPIRSADLSYNARVHLGYRGWPSQPLPLETLGNLNQSLFSRTPEAWFTPADLYLQEPWIILPPGACLDQDGPPVCAVGFSETHAELKRGLLDLLEVRVHVVTHPHTHWACHKRLAWVTCVGSWVYQASHLQRATVALCDCSALHVLAVALGTPVLLMEPIEARWNPIFYPLGWDGPQTTMIRGNDGRPTWDHNHVREAVVAALEGAPR